MVVVDGLLMGRVGRLDLERGEVPCALVRAQERMRSADELESGEVFFIDVECGGGGGGVVVDGGVLVLLLLE